MRSVCSCLLFLSDSGVFEETWGCSRFPHWFPLQWCWQHFYYYYLAEYRRPWRERQRDVKLRKGKVLKLESRAQVKFLICEDNHANPCIPCCRWKMYNVSLPSTTWINAGFMKPTPDFIKTNAWCSYRVWRWGKLPQSNLVSYLR